MQEIWQTIEQARLLSNSPLCKTSMNPPASKRQLDNLSEEIQQELPKQLYDSLAIHNGMPDDKSWFDDQCCTIFPMNRDSIAIRYDIYTEGREERKNWIPVLTDLPTLFVYFIDSENGSLFAYRGNAPEGQDVLDFRFDSYLDFLNVILDCIQNHKPFVWPS